MNQNKESDDRRWRILGSEYLFRKPWLTVRSDHVQLPSGVEIPDFYVLEYPTWANVIAITTEGKMVMVKQYRHGLQWTGYELCAGVVESDESPEAGARRELLEETGFGGGRWSLLTVLSPNPTSNTNLNYCFLAEGVTRISDPAQEPTEDITTHLMSPEEVMDLLQKGEIKQALMAAPLWQYFHSMHNRGDKIPTAK